jgi:hypothetical protein
MAPITPHHSFGELLRFRPARELILSAMHDLTEAPNLSDFEALSIIEVMNSKMKPSAAARLWARLSVLDYAPPTATVASAIASSRGGDKDVAAQTADFVTVPSHGVVNKRLELSFVGPDHGNPFVDVELSATFRRSVDDEVVLVGGFYDGNGRYVIRFLPQRAGEWEFLTRSNVMSLDSIRGSVAVADHGDLGVIGVADQFHFANSDGSPFVPVGTTLYAWTHQEEALEQRTLATLANAPFNKVRMCVFPKWYSFNTDEPLRYPFPRNAAGWDTTRFEPDFFTHLERRIDDLAALGIQADIILFHSYDKWGFAELESEIDDRYVRYLVRRLAAFPNVWWSMANEYDLLLTKTVEDWERLAAVVVAEDHAGHLRSIHNATVLYDNSSSWVTHASLQRIDLYRTAENVTEWRELWGKPVLVDEVGYEGDVDQAWGSLTGEELLRRFWEGTIRGGYLTHGETFVADDGVLWWSKGGELRGETAERIRFLRSLVEESPTGRLDPVMVDWDAPWAGVPGQYLIGYLGANRPSFRNLRSTVPMIVEIIDTWGMTISPVDTVLQGTLCVALPARPYLAIRLRAT